jgi:hypothetical protein
MRFSRLSLGLLFLVGCGSVNARGTRFAVTSGESRWDTCFPGRHYSEQQSAVMQDMRDQGASFAQIAAVVGGKPQDLRCWEARLRGWQPEGPALATAPRK